MREFREIDEDVEEIEKPLTTRRMTLKERDEFIHKLNKRFVINPELCNEEIDEELKTENNDVKDNLEPLQDAKCVRELSSSRKYEELDPDEIHSLYFEKKMSQKAIGVHLGCKSASPIRRIFKEQRWNARPFNVPKREIDPDEVRRLYYDKKMTQLDIAKLFGYHSCHRIRTIFEEQGWDIRPNETEIDPEEVHRLYFEEKWTQLEIGRHFGFKSGKSIQALFKEKGWNARHGGQIRKQINPEEIRRLYFDDKKPFSEIAEHFGLKSLSCISRLFEEQGWEARSLKQEIDPETIRRLYFDEKKTLKETAEYFGLKSNTTITRIFKEQGWEPRTIKKDVELDKIRRLYCDEEMDVTTIAKQMEVSSSLIYQRLKKMGVLIRKKHTLTKEEKIERKQENRLEIQELRETIFGYECVICGKQKEVIHRKDGEPHSSHILWSRKILQSLNPDEWAALCKPCHFSVHALMESRGFEWDDIFKILKNE